MGHQGWVVLVVEEWDRFLKRKASNRKGMLHEMWGLDLALGRTTTAQGGQPGSWNNIFKGITFCQCGAAMTDTTSPSGQYLDLVCSAQNSGRPCIVPTKQCWKVDEGLLLAAFMDRRWERFFKNPETGPRISELEERLLEEERVAGEYRTTATNF